MATPPARTTETMSASRPLVVDLDRTLLRCDLLHDALAGLALRSPRQLAMLAWKHRRNLAAFKTGIARLAPVSAADLPCNPAVLAHIRGEAAAGRRIILATASPLLWAEAVATHLGCFSEVLASTDQINLKGTRKLQALRRRLGGDAFDYIGDSTDDLPILRAATRRWLVGGSRPVITALKRENLACAEIAAGNRTEILRAAARICRPHHWVKNLLIFLPALTSLGLYETAQLPVTVFAFAAMCALASAVYIVNDLSDIAADRAHPEKKHRPLAAGTLSVPLVLTLSTVLGAGGLAIASRAGSSVVALLLVYLFINAAYTIRLKELPLADVCALTFFYLLRVTLGTLALRVPPTGWFLLFLGCIFMELAIWKRYVELIRSPSPKIRRRGYYRSDAGVLLSFGVGFSFCATLVLGMYTQSREISPLYKSPVLLALLAPILLVHNLGMWLDGSRGYTSGDPIMRVLHSRKSWLAAAAAAGVIVLARTVQI